MNWYQGSIPEAIQKSKTKNAIFVVYVEGKDEASQRITEFLNDEKIRGKLETDNFIAIKIESETQEYMQFASVYKVVPIPSLFFIGQTGTPLDIGTGIISSVNELDDKIINVLQISGKVTSASTSLIEAEQAHIEASIPAASNTAAKDLVTKNSVEDILEHVVEEPVIPENVSTAAEITECTDVSGAACVVNEENMVKTKSTKSAEGDKEYEIICDGDVCYKKLKEKTDEREAAGNTPSQDDPTTSNNDEAILTDVNARLAETRKTMEEQRKKRIEEENILEKERELRRRKEGKVMQNLQEWQRDQELKEMKENIRRDRLEEQAARERIRAQIAADRAERAQKFTADIPKPTPSEPTTSQAASTSSVGIDSTRIQFRIPNGENKNQVFKRTVTLSEVRAYVKNELLPGTGIKTFVLSTNYPKRELTTEFDTKTMEELELIPSAVILVIPKDTGGPSAIIARRGGLMNIFVTIFWAMLTPALMIFSYFRNMSKRDDPGNLGAQKRVNEEQGLNLDAAIKRRNLDPFLPSNSSPPDGGVGAGSSGVGRSGAGVTPTGNNESIQSFRRYGGSNIHRLRDNQKDSDDDNATWNGNSTQQQ
ncbi:UBX domain-containing protein 4 [Teleopsis dalmanni]|uniref:UBX domain-containing protein 4-like n=1 Tax=Teleopsis dalmanni TaxID=139649 RepID=UPI0018CF4DA7|nr:UBX domain-containing protein 4-like [Teleopsis dalmanni]XP_037954241.1 UBX domain-containing protein 4 [Teleopsis dalmanni]